MRTHLLFLLSLLLVLLWSPGSVRSWKKEEFRNCNQTPFCKRARGRKPGSCALVATHVSVSGGDLVAKLAPREPDPDREDQEPVKPLALTLSVYRDGVLRVKIDEDPSLESPKKRFQVPDVVVPGFESEKLWLQRLSTEKVGGDEHLSSIVFLSDDHEGVVRHDPFEVYVRERSSGDRVLSLNSHGLLDFEQLRAKKEGEEWEERFRSHTDTRPYGPQSISFDVSFYGADFVYGIPEHATSLALKPTRGPGIEHSEPYRLFNLDVFEFVHESPFGLYGSIPFMISHGKARGSSGFFWLNAAEMQIDVLGEGWDADSGIALPSSQKRVDTFWMSEAGIVDAFFFIGPGPKDVVKRYVSVTGMPAMPQLFATAYHQSRWNYRDEEDVENVHSKFDEHDIPCDVLWLDIDHTDGRRYFTWDKVSFPHPEEMQRKLAAKGRHLVTIVDPHIKRDGSYFIHKEASKNGYYIKDASGNDFDGWCWPGSSSYLDMLNPEIRSWWADRFSFENYVGSTPSLYIWNDMNEPSVFNGPELTMPRDALHYGGVEHRELHNANGLYFHMATSDGLLKRGNGNDRPFVLARAFFAGSQRYGAIWTGDNTADWDQLRVSVPMVLALGLTGISFTGADVSGYFGNPEPELFVRWYQLAAYYPFFRGHAHQDTKRREPWSFGERNTELVRDAIRTRYMLLPFFYTLFREANVTGVPVLRPLWMEFPFDEATFDKDEAFMVGNSLLVQGIFTERAKHVSVYLPGKESWYDLRTGTAYLGSKTHKLEASEDHVPAFQRAGTIIPRRDRFRRSTTQMVNDPYTLVIALNSSQAAEGELYIDDGKSFEFKHGAYIHRRFVFTEGKLTSLNMAPATSGNLPFKSECIIGRIILLGHAGGPKNALIEPGNLKAQIEFGPLLLQGRSSSGVLTIRKPGIRIADDWTIKVL
ncbi:probable glucan 1,3-alpha-glucosidase [Syzygium oleosum]|uniref:probable glucan 1,3-alpha-glucosidase n=1 Tax=Syzygium oleosum TaxID=219896 RepID=UPI0024B940E9|nr:probable glucan 1,3-alpha-glucosidase [Syzygium oleosum]XP_056159157.1 probable glucan 1,3-alpha-glucosidase [Syzygium oleosum]XP_056159158.1 probable glucan 1,3-alpha-glucosidase [Syzygium oleosum]